MPVQLQEYKVGVTISHLPPNLHGFGLQTRISEKKDMEYYKKNSDLEQSKLLRFRVETFLCQVPNFVCEHDLAGDDN